MKKSMIKMIMLVSCTALFATLLFLNADRKSSQKVSIQQDQAYADDPEDEDGDKFKEKQEYDNSWEVRFPVVPDNPICEYFVFRMWGTDCIGTGRIECETDYNFDVIDSGYVDCNY